MKTDAEVRLPFICQAMGPWVDVLLLGTLTSVLFLHGTLDKLWRISPSLHLFLLLTLPPTVTKVSTLSLLQGPRA